MARVEVHAGLAAIEYPNSLVDVHAATDAWSRVCWPLGMTTILPVTRVTGRASSRPAIVRSRSGLRERRGELRGRPRGDEEHFKRGGLRAAGCPKEERLLCLLRDGAAQRRRGGAAPRVRCDRVRADARAAIFAFLTRRRARPARHSNHCRQSCFSARPRSLGKGGEILPLLLWCSHVACYAIWSARFHRMAPRSEPLETPDQRLGSKRDTGIRSRSKLPERERSSSLASGLILAARAALEDDLAKGKGSPEAKGLP